MTRRLAITFLVLAMLVVSGVPAAATDGTDPNGTGCDASASTVAFINIDQGTTQLRYSSGCATAWARFICGHNGGCTNYNIQIFRNTDGRIYTAGVTWPSSTPLNASLYTLQLDDGAGSSAKACYQAAFDGYVWHCTSSF